MSKAKSSSQSIKIEQHQPSSSSVTMQSSVTIGTSAESWKTGQKFPTPSPGYGDRVFYETLIEQKPSSHMAQEWCVYYGVLDESTASKLYALINKRKGKPTSPSPANRVVERKGTKKSNNGIDCGIIDTGFEAAGVWEGQGSIGI